MARRTIRQNVDAPKAQITNFSKGMEYGYTSKATYNPRMQLVKNLEVTADGKLKTRRPLIPYKTNKQNFDLRFDQQPNTKVLKVIHTPFAGLVAPFIWIVANQTDGITTGIELFYFANGSTKASKVSDPNNVLGNIGFEDENQIDYIFKESLNFVLITARGGVVAIKDLSSNADNVSLNAIKPSEYLPTTSEITDAGLNLYLDNPFFISNTISYSTFARTVGIDPYDSNSSSSVVNSSVYKYVANPKPTDQIILKARFEISEEQIIKELNTFYFSNGLKKYAFDYNYEHYGMKDDNGKFTHATYEQDNGGVLGGSNASGYAKLLTDTDEWYTLLKKTSPAIDWYRESTDSSDDWGDKNALSKRFPSTFDAEHNNPDVLKYKMILPLILTFAGDETGLQKLNEIGQNLFKNPNWYFDSNDWGEAALNSYRQDVRLLPPGFSDEYKYKVILSWDTTSYLSFKLQKLNLGDLSISTAEKDKGIIFGDPDTENWASYYSNKYSDYGILKDLKTEELVKVLNPFQNGTVILSDFYAPKTKTKDGFHRIRLNMKSPTNLTGFAIYSPVPPNTEVTMQSMSMINTNDDDSNIGYGKGVAKLKGGH